MSLHDIRTQMANYNVYKDWNRKDSIERIVIHHSGAGTVWLNGLPNISLLNMGKQHVEEEGRAHVSYHYAINREGKVFYLLDEKIPGYHAALPEPSDRSGRQRWLTQWQAGQYFNRRSVGILVLGWFDQNRRQNGQALPNNETTAPSEKQWDALVGLVKTIRGRYSISVSHVQGHSEVLRETGFGNSTCPGRQLDMARLRAALGGGSIPKITTPQTPPPVRLSTESDNQLVVNGLAPSLKFPSGKPRWYYASSALIPSTVSPGIELDFPVAVGNGGQSDWLHDGPKRTSVAIKWIDANNREVGQAIWSRLPYNLSPGQRADFRMKIKTPTTPGRLRLRLSLYHSGYKKWFRQLDNSTAPDFFPTTVSSTRTLEALSSESSEVEPTSAAPPVVAVAYEATFPAQMTVGMQRELAVALHNQGTEPWLAQGDLPITVSHHWLNQEGYLVQPTLRTLLPRDVPPNDKLTLTIPLLAPPQAGSYRLQIDMVQEGQFFFRQRGNAPLTAQIEVNAAESAETWAAHWDVELPTQLIIGEDARIEVQGRNIGQMVWLAERIRLGYRWDDASAHRVTLPIDVPPGSDIALGVPLTLPEERGSYILTLDLWEEGNGWLEVGRDFKGLIILSAKDNIVQADDLVVESPIEEEPASPAEEPVSPTEEQWLVYEEKEERTAERTEEVRSEAIEESPSAVEDKSRFISESAEYAILKENDADLAQGKENDADLAQDIVVLPNRTIGASASHNPERAKYAVDGHKMTAWSSGEPQQPEMWFQLDLGQSRTIHSLRFISHPEKYPRGYIMQASQDGETWEELHKATENWADINQTLPSAKAMRYVRLTQTKQNPWGEEWSIRDVHIEVVEQG